MHRERTFPGTKFIKNEDSFDYELLLLAWIKNVCGGSKHQIFLKNHNFWSKKTFAVLKEHTAKGIIIFNLLGIVKIFIILIYS